MLFRSASVAISKTTGSLERRSSQGGKGDEVLSGEKVEKPRPNTPSGFHEYPNPIEEKENVVKAKALVEECQAMQVESKALVDIKIPKHQNYPMHRALVKVPSIRAEVNEERMSNDKPLHLDCMFEEDPIMERLRHEGLNNLHDDIERQSDGIIMPSGPRDVAGLDRKSTRLNSSHSGESRMPSSA